MRAVRFGHYDGHTGRLNYLSPLRDETGEWDAEGQTNFPVFYSAGTPAKNFRGFGAHGSFVRLEIHQHVEGVLGYGIDLHSRHAQRLGAIHQAAAEETPHFHDG